MIGQTKTTNNHDALKSLGIVPALKDEQATKKYSYVVFCAPPYGNDDYIGEIRHSFFSSGHHPFLHSLVLLSACFCENTKSGKLLCAGMQLRGGMERDLFSSLPAVPCMMLMTMALVMRYAASRPLPLCDTYVLL